MIDPQDVPPVEPAELLARFVLQSGHIRADGTVKQNVFIPYPHPDLSVTRYRSATSAEIWNVGHEVAQQRGLTFYGRANLKASIAIAQSLSVRAKPIDGNPNHADITDWPADKPLQKMIAQELAAAASFEPTPA